MKPRPVGKAFVNMFTRVVAANLPSCTPARIAVASRETETKRMSLKIKKLERKIEVVVLPKCPHPALIDDPFYDAIPVEPMLGLPSENGRVARTATPIERRAVGCCRSWFTYNFDVAFDKENTIASTEES